MRVPLEIAILEDAVTKDAVEKEIRKRTERLDRHHRRLTSCRVVLESGHRASEGSTTVRARVEVGAPPGHRLVGKEEAREDSATGSALTAVRSAFDSVERQLAKLSARQSGHVKRHVEQEVRGFVTKLFDDYGFLETETGREVYFHRNSVVGREFDSLERGAGVAFSEEAGREGPQASSVRVIVPPRSGR